MCSFGRFWLWAVLALNPLFLLRAQKWDPVAEFGAVNPSGVWSYGYSDRANGPFNLSTNYITDARYAVWGGTPSGPHVVKNTTGVTQNDGSRSHAPNQLNLDPSFDGRYAILRFTAPATALRASGRFVGIDSTSTDVAVVVNGAIVFSGSINGKGDAESFDVTFDGLPGETIDFAVGQGTGGSLFDGTGLELTIERASEIAPCAPTPADLAVWLPGNGVAVDVAGGTPVQLLQGAGYDQGKIGDAFSLVGRGNYIAVSDSAAVRPASKVTLEGWFRFNEPNLGSIQTLAGKTVGSAFRNSYALYYQNGELRGIVGNVDALSTPVTAAFRPGVGVWNHLAFTFNDETGSQSLYINGRLVAANTTDVKMGYDDHPLTLGAEYENAQLNYFFPGLIDEFSLYARDLSEAELSAIYRAPSGKCGIDRNTQCEARSANLAGWWSGEGTGLDTVTGNTASVTGVGYGPGKVGQGFAFDGVRSVLSASAAARAYDLTQNLTLEAWIKPTLLAGDQRTIVSKRSADNNNVTYVLFLEPDGRLAFASRSNGGDFNTVHSVKTIETNLFSHVAAVIDGSQLTFYINGQLDQQTAVSPRPSSSGPLTIGAGVTTQESAAGPFAGVIDEISIYNRALTAPEIGAIFSAGAAGKCQQASPPPATVRNIHGRSNIYASSGPLPADSLPPALFTFPARSGQILTFAKVDGSVSLNEVGGGLPFFGPDGGPGVPPTDIQGINGLSGIKHRLTGMLVGVFKEASDAVAPNIPPTLDFNAIGPDFTTLSPLLNQVFFIGDGRTSAGVIQEFNVPANASRLFLGIADGWNGSCVCGVPQAYADNGGGFQATLNIGTRPVISGQVLDDQGAPLAGVEVGAFRDATQFVALGFNGATTHAITDQNGRFTLSGDSAGAPAFVIPRIDYDRNGRDDDGRYFDPPGVTATASSNPASLVFRMRSTTDFTLPAVQITTPNPQGATEFSSLERVQGTATDAGAGMLDVWAALVKTVNGVQWVYNWNTRKFDRTNRDHPDYYGRTAGEAGASKDFTLNLPGLAAASYQVRLIAVDNARNFRRVDLNFRIVPQTQTLTLAGTFAFPSFLTSLPASLLANSGGSTTLKLSENTTLSSLELAAANNSMLAVVIEKGKQLASQNGITLGSKTSIASIGKVLGSMQNLSGSLTKSLSSLNGFAASLFGAEAKALLLKNIQPSQPKQKTTATAQPAVAQAALHAFAVESDITGSISIEGDYEQLPGAFLGIGIRGTNFASQEYDRLEVTGSAILEGRIGLGFYDPAAPGAGNNLFAPPLGATFDIVVATNIVVGDLQIVAPIWSGGLSFAWAIVDLPDARQALRLEVVEVAPVLAIAPTDTGMEILFPPAFSAYHLETTDNPATGPWTEIGGGANTVQLPRSDRARFFRAKR